MQISETIQTFMYSLKSKETQKQYSIYYQLFSKISEQEELKHYWNSTQNPLKKS